MNYPSVTALLRGYRDGRIEPEDVARAYDADMAAAKASAARWRSGSARALEAVPVNAADEAARAFAAEHGAFVVTKRAPLALGGGADALVASAKAGATVLAAPAFPQMTVPAPAELGAILEALGAGSARPVARLARLDALRPAESARRKGDDLAASLAGGLGVGVTRLGVDGPDRLASAAAAADALLLPLDPRVAGEAVAAGLALLAIPGAWGNSGHVGLALAGRAAAALVALGGRLHAAMGGGTQADADED